MIRLLAVAFLTGCGWFQGGPVCEAAGEVLETAGAETLTCEEAGAAETYVELLAARPMDETSRKQVLHALADRFRHDPAATRGQLEEAGRAVDALRAARGLEAAELRSEHVYRALVGEGPFGDADDELRGAHDRTVAVWTRSEPEKLALTEVDIEGWILYGSLCREVQGADPLRLSVADRVTVYRMIQDEFEAGARDDKIALVALGAFWPSVQESWASATWEQQQAWVSRAPLPPPMTATSKGYLGEMLDSGDLTVHARTFHEALGPLALAVVR